MKSLRGLIVYRNYMLSARHELLRGLSARSYHKPAQPRAGWALVSYGLVGIVAGLAGIVAASTTGIRQQAAGQPSSGYPDYADRETMLKAVDEIRAILCSDAVSEDQDDLNDHGSSEWSTTNSKVRPIAVVYPQSTEHVSLIARICTKYKVPMIPYGAGSSVEGNTSAPYSGITLDLSRMNRIVEFNSQDMDIVVEPGVNWVQLNEKIKPSGLFLPLDPSPTALIGGMVATNCSGTNAMRYGTMKDWVINLTVVLADGEVIKTRRRARKSSAGYNLNSLFTGSEGTLGIITQATLKLAVLPTHFGVATTTFNSVKDAAKAASVMIREGLPLAALELMDDMQMKVINETGGAGGRIWPEKATLFIKFSGTKGAVQESIKRVEALSKGLGGTGLQIARSEEEMNSLWSARKQALWSMLAIRPPGTEIWSTDVAVPLSRMAEIIDFSKETASRLGLFSSVLGHVGDGNFHQAILYNPSIRSEAAAVRRCLGNMVDVAIEMQGTVSGEHGIGLGKKASLVKELGPATINVMRMLKRSLDPHWLLNPGKVFDA